MDEPSHAPNPDPGLKSDSESPFSSLQSMRESNLDLLERQGEEPEEIAMRAAELQPDIDLFLQRGAALGRFLSAADQRAEAQNMLAYWVSTASVHQRSIKGIDRLPMQIAILERFDQSLLSDAIDGATRALEKLSPSEHEDARGMLMRLAPMEPDGDGFHLADVADRQLTGGKPAMEALLKDLKATGILICTPGDSPGQGDLCRLAHESVIHRWPDFAEWVAERRRLRQSVLLWENSGRPAELLSRGGTIQRAGMSYRDSNSEESDFLEASDNQERKSLRVKIAVLGAGLGLMVVAAGSIALMLGYSNEVDVVGERAKNLKGRALVSGNLQSEDLTALRAENATLKRQLDEMASELERLRQIEQPPEISSSVQSALDSYREATESSQDSKQTSARVAQALADPGARVGNELSPGVSVSRAGGQFGSGSAGVFLTDEKGATFLAAPVYVLGRKGDRIKSGDEEIGVVQQVFGTGENPEPTDIALARLDSKWRAENSIVSVGAIKGIARDVTPGTKVVLVGQGSGIREGEVIDGERGGDIVTTRISKAGDGGAPVVTREGELVGLLIEGVGDRSIIRPIDRLLNETGLKLLTSRESEEKPSIFTGALAQFIVPDNDPAYLSDATEWIKRFEERGIFVPDGTALPRPNTPEQVDVRYYYKEDQSLAEEVGVLLLELNLPEPNVYLVDDPDAPQKMIQIAIPKLKMN